MRAVYVLFDSINKQYLPRGRQDWVEAPNFERLRERSVHFDRAYVGSMACMPARREMHTGRYNFLHAPWCPLEPFDQSFLDHLARAEIHSHLVTDHPHYFSEGGSTYHTRFTTWEFLRGQEGDPWKGIVDSSELVPEQSRPMLADQPPSMWAQEFVNRSFMTDEADFPHHQTFQAGLDFLDTNHRADDWFLQIETFDAHEPFHTPARFRDLYPRPLPGEQANWPTYGEADFGADLELHWQYSYAAAITMIDEALGRLLDTFDRLDLWADTMLIVGTDHGFLLGEHGWWGKNVAPWYNEVANVPLFVWDPRSKRAGLDRNAFVQTIDIAPTILGLFGLDPLPFAQGVDLAATIADDATARTDGLFGQFGGHLNYTDGDVVYMRAPNPDTGPLMRYTLMPMDIRGPVPSHRLRGATLHPGFGFTGGVPLLRFDEEPWGGIRQAETLLFDLTTDAEQRRPLDEPEVERSAAGRMADLLERSEAPPELSLRFELADSTP